MLYPNKIVDIVPDQVEVGLLYKRHQVFPIINKDKNR